MPVKIDGTDITGATIDGTDVQEITVDGDTVFTAGPNLPVAYSNLVAWYPFDSATYGGSNADDVTAILGGSGDDTAYDGTVSGASYQSSSGVTDINAGANSGAFDFDGDDDISLPFIPQITGTKDRTYTLWFTTNTTAEKTLFSHGRTSDLGEEIALFCDSGGFRLRVSGGTDLILSNTYTTGVYVFVSFRISGSNLSNALVRVRSENGSSFSQDNFGGISQSIDTGTRPLDLGFWELGSPNYHNGIIEDFRIYDRNLTNSEEESIYLNTEP